MSLEMKQVMKKLDVIKAEIDFIKEHMVDADTILTPKEEVELDKSLKELKEGKTTSHEDLKKELGL